MMMMIIPPALWPPNSPDLSPVDDTVWSVMQEKATNIEFKLYWGVITEMGDRSTHKNLFARPFKPGLAACWEATCRPEKFNAMCVARFRCRS